MNKKGRQNPGEEVLEEEENIFAVTFEEESTATNTLEENSAEENSFAMTEEDIFANTAEDSIMMGAALADNNNTDPGRGFLHGYFTEIVATAAAAAGITIGTAGLALILCAAGTICGPVEVSTVETSIEITFIISRPPTDEELNGSDNAIIPLLERFYTNAIIQAFGGGVERNRALEEDEKITREVVDGEVDQSTYQITEFKFLSWTSEVEEDTSGFGFTLGGQGAVGNRCKNIVRAAGQTTGQRRGFAPDQQVIDLAIQRADLNDFLKILPPKRSQKQVSIEMFSK